MTTKPPQVLLPYDPREGMTVSQAAKRAGRTRQTVINWAMKYDIGRRVGFGQWEISRVAIEMLLDGNREALRAYLDGVRDGIVQAYFERPDIAAKMNAKSAKAA